MRAHVLGWLVVTTVSSLTGCTRLKAGSDTPDGAAMGPTDDGSSNDAGTPADMTPDPPDQDPQPTACPEVFSASFESGIADWTIWPNCNVDATWQVDQSNQPAPGGGSHALELRTASFMPGCSYPGVYALSPAVPVTPGLTYEVHSLGLHNANMGQTLLMFYDSNEITPYLTAYAIDWIPDNDQFAPDPVLNGVAPAGAVSLRVRYGLNSPNTSAETDLVRVVEVDSTCINTTKR
jgi:hypothetical protein